MILNINILQLDINLRCLCNYQTNNLHIVIKNNEMLVNIKLFNIVGIGIAPLELVTCSHVFSPQLPLNQTCKLSSPNRLWPFDASAPPTPMSDCFRGPLRQWDHLVQRQRCREPKLLTRLLPSRRVSWQS